jgi:rhamnosyl/mannosyltransferase
METHVQTLAQAQASLGAKVEVLCVNHLDRLGRDVTWSRFVRTDHAEVWDGTVRLTRLNRWASLARLDICPGLFPWLRRHRHRFDVLHLHAPNPTMFLSLTAMRSLPPLVVTHHSDVVRQKVLGTVFRPVESDIYRRAAHVLCDAPGYLDGSSILQRFRHKVTPLPLGIDLQPYLYPSPTVLAHRDRLTQTHGAPLWLSVGRVVYYKGLHNAIEALPHVPGKLLIVGNGPLVPALRELARDRGVADRVIWCGQVSSEELAGAYHAATALWFPSNARSEGFGLVQVEAMASSCPVINTAIPGSGVAWVSRHEDTGLTIPMNSPADLAAAARRLLDEPGLRPRLAAAGNHRARTEFDHLTMASRSLLVYKRALGRPPQRD